MKTKAVQVWTTDTGRELLRFDPTDSRLDSEGYEILVCHCNASDLRQLALAIRSALDEADCLAACTALRQATEQEEKANAHKAK